MDDRIVQFRVGVVVLATALIAGILIVAFGDFTIFGVGTYTVYVPFSRAPGIQEGTPVRKSGIRIGKVTGVKLTDAGVMVAMDIDDQYGIATHERCQISTGNLLGDAVLEFVPTRQPSKNDKRFSPNETLPEGIVQVNPLEMITQLEGNLRGAIASFTGAGESLQGAGHQVEALAATLNSYLVNNRAQLATTLDKTELAIDNFSKTMSSMNKILGDEKLAADLSKAMADFPQLLEEARTTMSSIRGAADQANTTIGNADGFAQALSKQGPVFFDNLNDSVVKLGNMLDKMSAFGDMLGNNEGTLGKILNDPEAYQNLNAAICNIREASEKLQPILDDVRVFSDKIARDPGRLGVSGAVRGRTINK